MSTDITEIKMTYFGQAAYFFTFDMMSRVSTAITSWNPMHDYTRVILPNYFDTASLILPDGSEKKYHYHKLMYGPMKTVSGKDVFKMRTDDEAFWLSQWGIEYSPFRVLQKILKDNGLYLVDHTFGGQVPFVYIYKFLPPRSVIKNMPWHDYHNIPDLNDADFTAPKLTETQIGTACLRSCIQLQMKFSGLAETVKDSSFRIDGKPVHVIHHEAPVMSPAGGAGASSGMRSYRDAVANHF
jgi:hypothetical protein